MQIMILFIVSWPQTWVSVPATVQNSCHLRHTWAVHIVLLKVLNEGWGFVFPVLAKFSQSFLKCRNVSLILQNREGLVEIQPVVFTNPSQVVLPCPKTRFRFWALIFQMHNNFQTCTNPTINHYYGSDYSRFKLEVLANIVTFTLTCDYS